MAEFKAVIPTITEAQFKCRVCLSVEENLYSFDDLLVISPDKELPIGEALCEVTSESQDVISNILLPCQICDLCVNQLRVTFVFIQSFISAQGIWAEYLSQCEIQSEIELKPHFKTDETILVINDNEYHNEQDADVIQCNDIENDEDISITKLQNNQNTATETILKINIKKLHLCPICDKSFSALDLKKHIKIHDTLRSYLKASGIPKYKKKVRFFAVPDPNITPLISRSNPVLHKCIYCDVRLPAQEFCEHINQHDQDGNVSCDICNRRFHNLKAMRTHRVKHIKDLPYTCNHCSKGFLDEDNYNCHLKAHKNEFLYKCETCGKRFSNPIHFKKHNFTHQAIRQEKQYQYKCKICLCRFQTKTKLEAHECVAASNVPIKKRTLCHLCGKYYNGSAHMAKHREAGQNVIKRTKQYLNQEKVLCHTCGQSVWSFYLAKHMRRHTGVPSIKCTICGKAFWRKEYLKAHLRVHTGEKPFDCRYCGMGFSRLNNMYVHERIHIGVKNHVCEICAKAFYEKSYLKKHMRIHNRPPEPPEKNKLVNPNLITRTDDRRKKCVRKP